MAFSFSPAGHATRIGRWWVTLRDHPGVCALGLGHRALDALHDVQRRHPDDFRAATLDDCRFRLIDESEAEPRAPEPFPERADYERSLEVMRRINETLDARAVERERQFWQDLASVGSWNTPRRILVGRA